MTWQHDLEESAMNTDNLLRASDAERSATADVLRRHHAEGRLDTDEFEERVERCYAAKTRGELDAQPQTCHTLSADSRGCRAIHATAHGRLDSSSRSA